jgi:transposase
LSVELESAIRFLYSDYLAMYHSTTMNKLLTIQKFVAGSLSLEEAIAKLQVSERTIYRYKATFLSEWPPWFIHWLAWKRSNNRSKKRRGIRKYAEKKMYQWFGPTLLSESLEKELGYTIPIESLRRRMIERWLWLPRKPKPPKRRPRCRKDWYWMMIQFDWSYHDWLENWDERCLLIWVDDATWKVVHATFAQSETIHDVITYWITYFEQHGKPSVIYLDRHASYKVNHRKDQYDHTTLTRFQTAMQLLWIEVIYARSAQWKWRVENKFKTFQDRWIKMMRIAWIKTYQEAEIFLQKNILPVFNEKFGKEPKVWKDYHVPISVFEKEKLERHFWKRTMRVMNKVWVVRYQQQKLLIAQWQELEHWNLIEVIHTHTDKIQLWSWNTNLDYKILPS